MILTISAVYEDRIESTDEIYASEYRSIVEHSDRVDVICKSIMYYQHDGEEQKEHSYYHRVRTILKKGLVAIFIEEKNTKCIWDNQADKRERIYNGTVS